jgi:hypothetical protein
MSLQTAAASDAVGAPAAVSFGIEFPISLSIDLDQGGYSTDKQWANYLIPLVGSEGYYSRKLRR